MEEDTSCDDVPGSDVLLCSLKAEDVVETVSIVLPGNVIVDVEVVVDES